MASIIPYIGRSLRDVDIDAIVFLFQSPQRDERRRATALSKKRESTLGRILRAEHVESSAIFSDLHVSPNEVYALVSRLRTLYPKSIHAVEHGGLGTPYDYTWEHEGRTLGVELKSSKSPCRYEAAVTRPWLPSVQFLQGQLTNPRFQAMLGSLGTPLLNAWYDYIRHLVGDVSREDYIAAVGKIGDKGPVQTLLRSRKSALASAWDVFSIQYLPTHLPDLASLTEIVTTTFLAKDVWIVFTPTSCLYVEELRCEKISFVAVGVKKKRVTAEYVLELCSKTIGRYTAPMSFRIHWKNGGQGVLNPNFMLA